MGPLIYGGLDLQTFIFKSYISRLTLCIPLGGRDHRGGNLDITHSSTVHRLLCVRENAIFSQSERSLSARTNQNRHLRVKICDCDLYHSDDVK
jgi:hypothetical protein